MSKAEARVWSGQELAAHLPALRRYARRLTETQEAAEDLVQDTVERAIARRRQFQPGSNLRTWLFTLLHNIHCDQCRRDRRRGRQVPLEEWSARAQMPAEQPGRVYIGDLDRALADLGEKDREILLLVGCNEYSHEEVSAELNIAVGTVKSRLSRARSRLRALDSVPGARAAPERPNGERRSPFLPLA